MGPLESVLAERRSGEPMTRQFASLAQLLALGGLVCAATVTAGWAQGAPVTRLPCGAYEAVPSGVGSAGKPTRLSIQKGGRLLLTISDWSITRVDCADFNNDKTLELLVTTYSGGAHCCETLRAWALGTSPRQILQFAGGNADGFELRDLDGDGRMELLIGDDSFAYFDDLCYACSPSHLPMVACYADGAFQDCTRRFPEVLRSALTRYLDRVKPPDADTDIKQVEGAALGVLAISVLLGEEDKGVEAVRQAAASEEVMKWLERARPKVRDWAEARGRKIKDGRQ